MAKLVIIVLCSVIVCSNAGLTPEQGEKLGGWQKTCFEQTGIDDQTLMAAVGAGAPLPDNINNHLICLAKVAKLMDPDGTYQRAKLTAELLAFENNPDLINAVVDKCDVDKGSQDATSLHMITCVFASFTTA